MRYFVMKRHEAFTNVPDLINWYNTFDVRKIRPEKAHEIPYRNLIAIRPDEMIMFTDIIIFPYLMVSKWLKDVLSAYEPLMEFKDIVLLDKVNKNYQLYYLPILEEIDCLHPVSTFNLDHSILRRVVLDSGKLGSKSIFRIAGVKGTYIVIRLDLAESILRRNPTGMEIASVEVMKGIEA